jgi:hypothetical protein
VEFSQVVEPVYHSPLECPRGNGKGNEAINEQNTRQEAETSTSHEVSAPELPLNQSSLSILSKISSEVEIIGEGFGEGQHTLKRWST